MRAEWAVIAGAGGIEGPAGFGFRPEVDFKLAVVDPAGEEEAVLDSLQVQGGEEAWRREFFSEGEDGLVETMVPGEIGEEGLGTAGHGLNLGNSRQASMTRRQNDVPCPMVPRARWPRVLR